MPGAARKGGGEKNAGETPLAGETTAEEIFAARLAAAPTLPVLPSVRRLDLRGLLHLTDSSLRLVALLPCSSR